MPADHYTGRNLRVLQRFLGCSEPGQEVLQEPEAGPLAFLRMELDRKQIVAGDR